MKLKHNIENINKTQVPPEPWGPCDWENCPAKRAMRVLFKNGWLEFCGHHFKKVEPTLPDYVKSYPIR